MPAGATPSMIILGSFLSFAQAVDARGCDRNACMPPLAVPKDYRTGRRLLASDHAPFMPHRQLAVQAFQNLHSRPGIAGTCQQQDFHRPQDRSNPPQAEYNHTQRTPFRRPKMPYCRECGNEVAEHANFCRSCGATIGASPTESQAPPAQGERPVQSTTPEPTPGRGETEAPGTGPGPAPTEQSMPPSLAQGGPPPAGQAFIQKATAAIPEAAGIPCSSG